MLRNNARTKVQQTHEIKKKKLKAMKEILSQKRRLFAGAKLRYKHLLGKAKAGKPASVAIR